MKKTERLDWASMVYKQMCDLNINFNDEIVWLCGSKYRQDLIKYFPHSVCPLEGLGIGQQLSFMTKLLNVNKSDITTKTLNEEVLW